MTHIYIALVDTPGFFASLIRLYIKQREIHVVLSLDAALEEAYSVGRRWPSIPLLAGFEREEKYKILRAFPSARYRIYRLNCTQAQKEQIRKTLREDYCRRYSLHYAVLGLLFLVRNRAFYQRDHYTCSSYIARVLEENGLLISKKHFSLVTPKDFYEYEEKEMIFEGYLKEIILKENKKLRRRAEAAYE